MVEITTTRDQSPELDGVAVHRLADLHPRWITAVDGMPCTTVARTLVDLGAVMAESVVARCLDRALGRGLVSVSAVETARQAVARQGRRGAGVIRRVLVPHLACEPVAGVFEARMARLARATGAAAAVPEYEVWTDSGAFVARVDFAYPELRLAIEVDGFAAHSSVDAFRRDRTRQNALIVAALDRPALHLDRGQRQLTERRSDDPHRSFSSRSLSRLFLARSTANRAVQRAKNEQRGQAPYFMRRLALASMIAIRSLVGRMPRPPRRHQRSP